jgi:uncharacterized protein HemX
MEPNDTQTKESAENQTEMNTSSMSEQPTTDAVLKSKDGKAGPLIGSILIILIILLGGLYYLDSVKGKLVDDSNKQEEQTPENESGLEAELDSEVNIDEIESSFDEIDAEFDAAFEAEEE